MIRNELIDYFNRLKNKPIHWFIKIDRTVELTGSLHPCGVTDLEWYDEHYAPIVEATIMSTALKTAAYNFAISCEKTLCPLCFEDINHLSRNIIILKCGHIYHYREIKIDGVIICGGIKTWLIKKNTCGTCREGSPEKIEYF
jgi:hypothetical protein